ncbi:MAG: hypothetical protein OXC95_07640 [Dehalococcoidia bacterium]|nr:hypothetical protein [Dehalococcoidia bacterium]
MEEFAVLFSIGDALQILDGSPLQPDVPTQTTFVQISNRVPIAHLAIERGLKFLIKKRIGEIQPHHDLHKHLRRLRELDPSAVAFLEKAFDDTTAFYGLDPDNAGLGHIRSLNSYLETVGTAKAFNSMRYWELDPEQEEPLFRKIWPTIHREILLAISRLHESDSREDETIAGRVEQTIHNALFPIEQLGYSPGSDHEATVMRYIHWVRNHPSLREALTDAFHRDFAIGDEFMNRMVRQAYQSLTQSPDPAIRYLVSRIDVLPAQPREVIPLIEWSDPQNKQLGKVLTPGGTALGLIRRTLDGIWHILPFRTGTAGNFVRARSQTDARSYLAQLLSDTCTIKVNDKLTTIRLVGEPPYRLTRNYGRMRDSADSHDSVPWTHRLNCWEQHHDIKPDDQVRVEVPDSDEPHFIHVIEGQVTLTNGAELFIEGRDILGVAPSSLARD